MNSPYVPPLVQAVGLACIPVADMPPGSVLARKPVAAAVVTVQEVGDDARDVVVQCLSDARDTEFPLPVLLDRALAPDALTLMTPQDRATMAVDAAARRFFVEPRLAALREGAGVVDPAAMFAAGSDERALCRRLAIDVPHVNDRDIELTWDRRAPVAAEGVALAVAVSRLMIWAHGASFQAAVPDPFFEVLLPLGERLIALQAQYPLLTPLIRSRPVNRARSFQGNYRAYRAARDAGDAEARWVTFEDNLLHV